MRYQFEYFYVYKGKLLLSETIESMEQLVELAAIEQLLTTSGKKETRRFPDGNQRAASPLR
jgi:hypothetical protein